MRGKTALLIGLTLIAAGALLLLANYELLPASLYNLWPVPVMVVGVVLLARAVSRSGRGMVGAVLVLVLGVFWLLDNYGRVTDQMFLPVVLIALGVGLLGRTYFAGRAG